MTSHEDSTTPPAKSETVDDLTKQVQSGQVGRRDFLRRAVLLGLTSAAAYKALESQATAQTSDITIDSPNQTYQLPPSGDRVTTQAIGEEGTATTMALGEEGNPPAPSTRALGEEGHPTTFAVGEEGQPTTFAVGEEGSSATTFRTGEEQPSWPPRPRPPQSHPPQSHPTTQALGEESPRWPSPVRPYPRQPYTRQPYPSYPFPGSGRPPWRSFQRW